MSKNFLLFFLLPACLAHAQQSHRYLAEGMPFTYTFHKKSEQANRSPYRNIDGTNNNSNNLAWGASDIPLFRELKADYDKSDLNNAMSGRDRPSPREISNKIVREDSTSFNSRNLSAMTYVWGQFLDHDISLTPGDVVEESDIPLPGDESLFTAPIKFYRSAVRQGTGITTEREQSNFNTAWIDGSVVYGSDDERAAWLRTFNGGKMKTSAGNFLPYNTNTGEADAAIDVKAPSMANDGNHTTKTFVAGDVRAAEHPGILCLHTIFLREHNRICDSLIAAGLTDDEEIYQKARKEVGAEIQKITYEEFLPALGINVFPFFSYASFLRPDLTNTFSTAAYRLGHTMVADDIFLRDNNCADVGPGDLDLIEAFWNPKIVTTYGPDILLKGFVTHKAYETDVRINTVLRDFLFGSPNESTRFGVDLASLNIQRGRDHGLPDYATVRAFYGAGRIGSFADVTSNTALQDSLQELYKSVNNIDLWVGLLSEDRLKNKSVGRTLNAILTSQFTKLRNGDFYFYLRDPYLPSATRDKVRKTTLAQIIQRNTNVRSLQHNVFFVFHCPGDTSEDFGSENIANAVTTKDALAVRTSEFKVYPNPVKDELNVDIGTAGKNYQIKIFNSIGVQIKEFEAGSSKTQINVRDLKSGTYFMRIIAGNKIQSTMFIKIE